MRKFISLSLGVLCALQAMAWGPKGHDVVAYIAEQHLSRKALKKVESALGGHTMVYVANWMDNASHMPTLKPGTT